jgi:uncharacterized membrane protein
MNVQRITLTAICIAIVTIFVATVQIVIPGSGGYVHLGAIAEIFVAIAFGPVIGGVAAGVGAALADLITGFAPFAPLTLVAHGSLGILVGLIGWRKGKNAMLIGWIVGGLALVIVYFLGEALFFDVGVAGALSEVPANLGQVSLGILGFLQYRLVKQAYPQIDQLAGKPAFQER